MQSMLEQVSRAIDEVAPVQISGVVKEVRGEAVFAALSGAALGDLVLVTTRTNQVRGRVIGFAGPTTVLSAYDSLVGLIPGARVRVVGRDLSIPAGPELLGTVLDCFAKPLSGYEVAPAGRISLRSLAPGALEREMIREQFVTGIRAIDAFVPLGRGQRLAVFAEPGVGKSTLLAQAARMSAADVNIIALVGERGREVREFVDICERTRTIIVAATSDETPLRRVLAASTATRLAEYFRDSGKHVLLQIDSLTRLMRAEREIGLGAGELPVRRGYPPSVFTALPRLIERAGNTKTGSVTALYTVLLSSDLDEDPMVEEVKGLTDGHLILSRQIAERGCYPALDIVRSLSRLAPRVQPPEVLEAAGKLRRFAARLERDRDIAAFGGIPDEELQQALVLEPKLGRFLSQEFSEHTVLEKTYAELLALCA